MIFQPLWHSPYSPSLPGLVPVSPDWHPRRRNTFVVEQTGKTELATTRLNDFPGRGILTGHEEDEITALLGYRCSTNQSLAICALALKFLS